MPSFSARLRGVPQTNAAAPQPPLAEQGTGLVTESAEERPLAPHAACPLRQTIEAAAHNRNTCAVRRMRCASVITIPASQRHRHQPFAKRLVLSALV
ncbi:MAG: hypothetical protein R3E31_08125 [Chloroflexota bacterium]